MIENSILQVMMLLGMIGCLIFWTRLGRWLICRFLLWILLVLIIHPTQPQTAILVVAITAVLFRTPLVAASRWLWWRLQDNRGLRLHFNTFGE